ncbi:MAG: hypothetical protein HQL35_04865 [Alphaproteobacteria bacterium]|nr:hypothetical protein [Alphaproteobacteria bacterium]
MSDDRHNLPPLLADVAERAGVGGALKLMTEFGGQEITVPKIPRPGQVLYERCGRDVAEALADLRGGEIVPIPNGACLKSKKRAIADDDGPSNTLAKRHGVTSRYVRQVRNATPAPMPLFDKGHRRD